jgi:hypothetical protein
MGPDAVHLGGAAFPRDNTANSARTVPTGPRSQGPASSSARNNQAKSQIPPINQPRDTSQAGAAVPYSWESFDQWHSRVTGAQNGNQPAQAGLSKAVEANKNKSGELTASQGLQAGLTCGHCAGKRGREGGLIVTYSGIGHSVKDCTRLVDTDGFVNACPFCNKGDHNPNTCKSAHTLTDAYYLLVVCRHGKPPIRCNWDLKALDPKRWETEKFRPQNPAFAINRRVGHGDQALFSTIMAPLWTNGGKWLYTGFFGNRFKTKASPSWRGPPKGGEHPSSTLGSNRTSTQQVEPHGLRNPTIQTQTQQGRISLASTAKPDNSGPLIGDNKLTETYTNPPTRPMQQASTLGNNRTPSQQVGHRLPTAEKKQTSATLRGPNNPQPSSRIDISGQVSDKEQRDGRSVSLLAKLEQKLNSFRQPNCHDQHQGTTDPEPKRSAAPQLNGQGQQQGVLRPEQKLSSPPQPNHQRQQQAVLNPEPKRSSLSVPNDQAQQQRAPNLEQNPSPPQSSGQTGQEVSISERRPSRALQPNGDGQQEAGLSSIPDSIVRERMELEQEVEELEKLIKLREKRSELRKRLRELEDEEAALPSSKSRAVGERGNIRALGRSRGSSSPRRELNVATTEPAHMKEQAGGEGNLGSRGDRYRPDARRRRDSRDGERSRSRSRERRRMLRSPSPSRPSRDRVIVGATDTLTSDSPAEKWKEAIKAREAQAKAYVAAQNEAREKAGTDSRGGERERTLHSTKETPAIDSDPSRMRLADVSGRGLNRTTSWGTELHGSDGRETVPALSRGHRSSSKEELPAAAPAQTQDPIIKQEFAPHSSLWTD